MLRIAIDYESILRDRVLIITGVGRSGTTILGKLIGSMAPTVYLFEPAIMKYWFPRYEMRNQAIWGILVEDYFLPKIQGRNKHPNPEDDTWDGHYWVTSGTCDCKVKMGFRHKDALVWSSRVRPLWIIKSNEFSPNLTGPELFPGQKVLHIYRNGLDVVSSVLEHGWYTDEWCQRQIDWVEESGAPWYVDKETKLSWREWNPATRAAHCWRKLLNEADAIRGVYRLQYEGLGRHHIELFREWFGIESTEITERHIKSIKWRQRPQIDLNDIQAPERDKFREKMEQLRYL